MLAFLANVRPVPEQVTGLACDFPNSTALMHGNLQISFKALDTRAAKFASYLAELGVERGGTVAICAERSIEWIVAALGIMRAGAAYVPLDTAWPEERLRFAIENSGASVVVGRRAAIDRLRGDSIGLDPWLEADALSAAPLRAAVPIPPESLAYVIYTSGSTGVPKGVEITHANLAHLVHWHGEAFKVTPRDRASHLAGLGFDAAVWEIWPSLAAGATLCLVDDEVRSSPELLQRWMIEQQVTIGFVPTVHAQPMMELAWPAETGLRLLLTGGDALPKAPPAGLPFEVVNNYGPTECTVVATSSWLQPGSKGAPPIGRAIAGATLYLLNEHREPVADGSVGEIYIGGSGVGHGYRNLPESTAACFLPDPFAETAGARMYRSGDRGLRRTDGEIEFHGRLDRQAKIRGYRIELDEIGSVLMQHAKIAFAAAVVYTPTGQEKQLLTYVVPADSTAVTAEELQRHLLSSLPDYMVPSLFVKLQAIPLSANGKIDLNHLPPPTAANRLEKTATAAAPMPAPLIPSSPIEEKLLSMLRLLLDNNSIAAKDNIFLAGGHSLLGMQLVIRLRQAFGVDVTLRQLFESPTVERLAVLVEKLLVEAVDSMSEEQAQALLAHYGAADAHV